MHAQRSGAIGNISSTYGHAGTPGASVYSDSKRAVEPHSDDRSAVIRNRSGGTMDQSEIAAAAREFETARARGEYLPKAWVDRLSFDDAYRILLALIGRRRDEGARRIGWKIGLTAPAIQEQFGLHEPVFACLLAEGLVTSGHAFRRDALIEPGFENELCIVLDPDLPANATPA